MRFFDHVQAAHRDTSCLLWRLRPSPIQADSADTPSTAFPSPDFNRE